VRAIFGTWPTLVVSAERSHAGVAAGVQALLPLMTQLPALPAPSGAPALPVEPAEATLIWDLVRAIRPPAEVLQLHGLTVREFATKQADPLFVSAYRQAKQFWLSDSNIRERIKLKSAALLEDSIEHVGAVVQSKDTGALAKLDAVEKLGKLSDSWDTARRQQGAAQAQQVNITIDLGDRDSEKVVVSGKTIPVEVSADE